MSAPFVARRGQTKPFTFDSYSGPVRVWTWFRAATDAQRIARVRQGRGETASSYVVELATGRRWDITPDTDLVALHDAWKAEGR